MKALVKFAMISQQTSGTFQHQRVLLLSHSSCISRISICYETMETQYSTTVHSVLSMLASSMHHEGKDYHHYLACISHQLHSNFLYTSIWQYKRIDVFFIFFNTGKFLLFCISLISLVSSGISVQTCSAFLSVSTHLLQLLFSSCLLFSDNSCWPFYSNACTTKFAFSIYLSLSTHKSFFNLDQILSTCSPEVP